ncbi:MAG: cyclase family protein [Saprospiraceae bacterium]|jgi:kynurenine formamidase|nr:cyclase family protein [Saprospiraceae bacterium]
MLKYIDLSHTIEDGMITYKGLPAPIICDYLSREASKTTYAKDTQFQIGKIEMVANTGTYIDAPFHRFEDGKDLSELPLEKLAHLPAVLIDATKNETRAIGKSYFKGIDIKGKAILIRTDWSQYWRTDQYFENAPFLTADAAVFLRNSEVRLVGIDSYNIDNVADGSRPVHTVLLGAEIPIVEHMTNLESIPNKDFRFSAIPPKVKGFGTFPVRAIPIFE